MADEWYNRRWNNQIYIGKYKENIKDIKEKINKEIKKTWGNGKEIKRVIIKAITIIIIRVK